MTKRSWIRGTRITLASLSLLLAATACGSDEPSSAPASSASQPAATSTSPTAPATESPSQSAASEQPMPVFPDTSGQLPLRKKNGKLSCDPGDPTQQLKLNGAVTTGEQTITTVVAGDRVTVTVDSASPGPSYGYVNDTLPILLSPPEPDSLPFKAFYMDQADFGGKIKSINLCGGAAN